jgi:hypothetical protein
MEVKRSVYCGLVLAILLYGAEHWCLTAKMVQVSREFHHRCMRSMCRLNLWHTRHNHVKTSALATRLGIQTIETYITRRRIAMAWARVADAGDAAAEATSDSLAPAEEAGWQARAHLDGQAVVRTARAVEAAGGLAQPAAAVALAAEAVAAAVATKAVLFNRISLIPQTSTDRLPLVESRGIIPVESRKNGQIIFRGIIWWNYLVGSTEFSRPPARRPVAARTRAPPRAVGSGHPAPHRGAPFAARSLCRSTDKKTDRMGL